MRAILIAAAAGLIGSTSALALEAGPLVDGSWLSEHLDADGLVVIDLRNAIGDGSYETYLEGHIPGAVHSDYLRAGWRQEVDGVIGQLPPVEALESLIGGLGVGAADHVVVVPAGVSSSEFGSATRVYWTFKVLGHEAVSILDGGYAGWVEAGLPVETGPVEPQVDRFVADFQPRLLATAADVEAALVDGGATLIDARPAAQYAGKAAHPKAGRPGTLPGAINVPQSELVTADTGFAVTGAALDDLLAGYGAAGDEDGIAFCNTGHWASVAWFAVSELGGNENVRLYDGSMVGWTADPDRPVEVGAAN